MGAVVPRRKATIFERRKGMREERINLHISEFDMIG